VVFGVGEMEDKRRDVDEWGENEGWMVMERIGGRGYE
jgi:hypothetical protein